MSYDRNDYADTNCPDVSVPHHLSILRCEHRKEAYVKQLRHPSTVAHVYYCCSYTDRQVSLHYVIENEWKHDRP
jgi:hypothetical protein